MSGTFGICFSVLAQDSDTAFHYSLAEYWAPIHYQQINKHDGLFNQNSLNGKSDSLGSFDFDDDWNATNNWDNLINHNISPSVYFYVARTETHYFITYGFFHSRDWTTFNLFHLGQHENDLEGITLVIQKDDTKFGQLILGYSIFHFSIQQYSFIVDPWDFHLKSKHFKKGTVEEGHHPKSFQQAKGHGIKLTNDFFKEKRSFCRYIPASIESINSYDKHYKLIDLSSNDQLIEHINNPAFFNSDQTIKGSKGQGAKPPWLWTDRRHYKANPELKLFADPAKYVLMDVSFETPFSTEYTHHPYLKL